MWKRIFTLPTKGLPVPNNLLVGDFDSSLGSGARGWVIIDSSTPEIAVIQDPAGLAAGQGNAKFIIVKDGPRKDLNLWIGGPHGGPGSGTTMMLLANGFFEISMRQVPKRVCILKEISTVR